MERWQEEIETILKEQDQGDKGPLWLLMTEQLIELTREVESLSGSMGEFVERVLRLASEKNSPLVAAYVGFRLGVAYERYQNANRA